MKTDRKFYIQTFGCRCNQADSAAIRENLCRSMLREADSHSDADLVLINTCTVTHHTDQQVRQTVRKVHRENPSAQIVVTGCYAERDPRALAAMAGVNLVIGNADKNHVAEILAEAKNSSAGRIIRSPFDSGRDFLEPQGFHPGGKTRPFVKLQDGCDARCSYCIIPTVRGPGRSARPDDTLDEIRTLIENGYREIVLTGVNLGCYGHRLDKRVSLETLIQAILELPGLGRLRLSSIEPMRFSRAIVDIATENPLFAPHFHIPMQSGSDRILRRMRRPYTAARFLGLLEHIRVKLPAAGLGSDVLVGFPGETEEDFEATCRIVRDSPLTYGHVFPFSAREGTAAFALSDHLPPALIHHRARTMRDIVQAKHLAFRSRFLGQVLKGITLCREEEMGDSAVLTENYITVRINGPAPAANTLVEVRIDDVQQSATRGIIWKS